MLLLGPNPDVTLQQFDNPTRETNIKNIIDTMSKNKRKGQDLFVISMWSDLKPGSSHSMPIWFNHIV
jgi:hypothetical protein